VTANPQPTYASFLGVSAPESSFGAGGAPAAFIPVTSMSPADKLMWLVDEGWRGAPVKTYGGTPGPLYAEYEYGGDVFADTIGYAYVGLLGDVTVTGSGAPYTTAIATLCSGNQQPPTYCFTDWNSNITGYQLAGARMSELDLKFSGSGKLEYTAKATVLQNTVNGSKPSYVNTAVPIVAGWKGVVQLGGTTVGYVVEGEQNTKRAIDVIDTADGSQAPYYLFAGEVTADGKLTIVMENDTWRANYTAGTVTSLDINYAQGTGASLTQVKTHCSTIRIEDAKVGRGKSYAELELTYTADGNSTDVGASGGFSPVKVTLQNANPTGTYK
jgi:hypothetical protein